MPHTRTNWMNYSPPAINAANLLNMEDGIWYGLAHSGGIRNTAEFLDRNPASTTGGLAEAIADLGGSPGVVFAGPQTHPINANYTIPSNVHLIVPLGATFAIANGVTLTINGPLEAGLWQIFSWTGTGAVTFGVGSIKCIYPEWWGQVGTSDDTSIIQKAATALPSFCTLKFTRDNYYISTIKFLDKSNINISGPSTLKTKVNRGAGWWHSGCLIFLKSCSDVLIENLAFDGNRLNQVAGYYQNVGIIIGNQDTGDYATFVGDNEGETKSSKNITIQKCQFYRLGSFDSGSTGDYQGDGVYAFAVDGLTIQNNYFENMGRWAFAGNSNFNVWILGNEVSNATAGDYATALGSFDFEEESGDGTNGSYSRNIYVEDNVLNGRVLIAVQPLTNPDNDAGAYHYIRNIHIKDNIVNCYRITVGESIIACNVASNGGPTADPELSGLYIEGNVLKSISPTPITYGVSVYTQASTYITKDVFIDRNTIRGTLNGIYFSSGVIPILNNINIGDNFIIAEHDAATGKGIYYREDYTIGLYIKHNYISDFGTMGIEVLANNNSIRGEISHNVVNAGLATFTGTGIWTNNQYPVIHNTVVQAGGSDNSTASSTRDESNSWNVVQAWQTPGFQNNWVNWGGGYPTAQYFKDDFGIVHLKGRVKDGSGIPTTIFTLPAGYRPTKREEFAVNSNGAFGVCDVDSNGVVVAQIGNTTYFCLNGITFRAA